MNRLRLFRNAALICAAVMCLSVMLAGCKKDKEKEKEKEQKEAFYTVTFDAGGGVPAPAAQQVTAGETATAPVANPEKQEYVFMFWHLSVASTAYDFQTPVNSNITLVAKWEDEANFPYSDYFGTWRTSNTNPTWVTISADKIEWTNYNGVHCTISGLTWTEVENPGGDLVADFPSGYRVTGTYELNTRGSMDYSVPRADGSGNCTKGDIALNTFYISADRMSFKNGNWSTAEQEATGAEYYKIPDIEFCQITYNLNGGELRTVNNAVTKVPKGVRIYPPDDPVKVGDLVFEGWYTNASLTGSMVATIDVTDNITLYAKWSSETYLQKAVYSMGYAIQIAELVAGGLKPTAITGVLTVDYLSNGLLNRINMSYSNGTSVFYWGDGGRQRPSVISRYPYNGSALSSTSNVRDGTYDYARDPACPIAFFLQYQPNNPFVSLSNLQKITNNPAITQMMYDNMRAAFPSYSYKMLVFGINSKKELMVKYIGFKPQLFDDIFYYWCLDPESPDFGGGYSTMPIPN